MTLITTQKDLDALMAQLTQEAAQDVDPFVAIDTEFLRETTYWALLCLIQIGTNRGVWMIDPLPNALNLQSFFDLLQNESICKVLHAARQDLEIFYNLSGALPRSIFDTQVGAMVCGLGDSIGYESVVRSYLNQSVNKSMRVTDWSRRPLAPAQLAYAQDDVRFLVPVYEKMRLQLKDLNRYEWAQEETDKMLVQSLYEVDPEECWRRLKAKQKNPHYLARLKNLARWREQEAKSRNLARPRILRDEVLEDIVLVNPKTLQEFSQIRSFKEGTLSTQNKQRVLDLLHQANAMSVEECPQMKPFTPPGEDVDVLVEFLKLLLRFVAKENKVSEKIIAGVRDLEALALLGEEAQVPCLVGWRHTMFGERALKLLQGQTHVVVQGKTVIFQDVV